MSNWISSTQSNTRTGDFRPGREEIANSQDFKTPRNMVIADGAPERKFIGLLCDRSARMRQKASVLSRI